MNTHTTPGVRFSRIGSTADPQHLIDIWLAADTTRAVDYAEHPGQYRAFQKAIDQTFGYRARFTFVGELDPREDLAPGGRLQELLDSLAIDTLRPAVSCTPLAVSIHAVPNWPDYCILLSGWASNGTDWSRVKVYVVRLLRSGPTPDCASMRIVA